MRQKKDQWATATQDVDCTGTPLEIWRGQFAVQVSQLDRLLEAGYAEAARERVALFAKHLRAGFPIPKKHFLRFCDQLEQIAAGENPANVLGLQKRKGKKPDIKRLNRLNGIAESIWRLTINGKTVEAAIAEVADSSDWPEINEREAQLAWEVFGKSYRELEASMEQGLPNMKPLKRSK